MAGQGTVYGGGGNIWVVGAMPNYLDDVEQKKNRMGNEINSPGRSM